MDPKVPVRRRRNGLAAFRAVEPEVRSALKAGWTLVAIYEQLQARLALSYAQFARYAQPLRRASRAAAGSVQAPAAARRRTEAAPTPALALLRGAGPPRGRPEEVVPTLDMDGFAAKALRNEDLF
jgi:hypothetical protein